MYGDIFVMPHFYIEIEIIDYIFRGSHLETNIYFRVYDTT